MIYLGMQGKGESHSENVNAARKQRAPEEIIHSTTIYPPNTQWRMQQTTCVSKRSAIIKRSAYLALWNVTTILLRERQQISLSFPSPFPHFTFRQDDPGSLEGSFFLFHPVYISVDSQSLDAVDSSFLLSKHHLTFLWSLNVPTTLVTPWRKHSPSNSNFNSTHFSCSIFRPSIVNINQFNIQNGRSQHSSLSLGSHSSPSNR